MKDAPFHPKVLTLLVVLGAASFLSALVWSAIGDEPASGSPTGKGNDTFSRGALGHAAVVDVLRELDYRVVIGRFGSGRRAGSDGLLVLAETQPDYEYVDGEPRVLEGADRVLVVLPKWEAAGFAEGSDGPVREVRLARRDHVQAILWELEIEAVVVRPRSVTWLGAATPSLAQPQLLKSRDLRMLIGTDEGAVLFGHVEQFGRDIYVLSDPDLIANHGLEDGDNATIAIRDVIATAARGRETIVFDETLHGYRQEPSFWRALFEFPLVLVTMQVVVAAAVLLWAAAFRFGAPVPVRRGLSAGKDFLIENIASLLRFGGHGGAVLRRYLEAAVGEAHRRLHAPGQPGSKEGRAWLDRFAAAREVEEDLADLDHAVARVAGARRATPGALLDVAGRIHRWREEMIHGSGRHS